MDKNVSVIRDALRSAPLTKPEGLSSEWMAYFEIVTPLHITSLIADLDSLQERVDELELFEAKLIAERDSAEEALAEMYKTVTGSEPEWSNMFQYQDAIEGTELQCNAWRTSQTNAIETEKRVRDLEANQQKIESMSVFTDEKLNEIELHRDNSLLGHLPADLARELRQTRSRLGNYFKLLKRADVAERRERELENRQPVKLPAGCEINGFTMLIEAEVVARLQESGIQTVIYKGIKSLI